MRNWNSSVRKLISSQLNYSEELTQFSVLILTLTWYLSASISTYLECPSLSGLKHCLWLKHMALKYQNWSGIYISISESPGIRYSVLAAAKNSVCVCISKGFRKSLIIW